MHHMQDEQRLMQGCKDASLQHDVIGMHLAHRRDLPVGTYREGEGGAYDIQCVPVFICISALWICSF